MIYPLDISAFRKVTQNMPVADVRSPFEYHKGHMPEAFSLPLLQDQHRQKVGRVYKQKGRQDALVEGLRLAGPHLGTLLNQALFRAADDKLALYCWRGGMRSSSLSYIFSLQTSLTLLYLVDGLVSFYLLII